MVYNVSLEDSSPLISYSPPGAWRDTPQGDSSSSSYSDSSFHTTSTQGASLSFSFNGTGVWLYGARRTDYGSYTVSIDGVEVIQNDAGSSDTEFKQLLGGVSSLQTGSHEVTLTNTGSMVDLDYMVFEAQSSENTTTSMSTFDDSDPHITYGSQWTAGDHPGFYNSTIHYTQSSDASLGFSFNGEAIAIYGTVAASMGNYTVNLDGVEKVFNAGSAGSSQVLHANTLLYFANNIGAQSHNVVLTANPSALGDASYFELDSISVASADGSSADVLGYPSSVTTTQPSSVTPPDLTETQSTTNVSSSNQFVTSKGVVAGAACAAVICALGIIFLCIFLWKRRRSDPISYMDVDEKDVPKMLVSAFSPITPNLPLQDVEKQVGFAREVIAPAYREFSAYDSYYESVSDRSTFYEDHSTYGSTTHTTRSTPPHHAHSNSLESDITLCTTDTAPLNLTKKQRIDSDSSIATWQTWETDSRSSYSSTASTMSADSRRIMINNMPMPPQFMKPMVPARAAHPARPSRKRDTIPIPF